MSILVIAEIREGTLRPASYAAVAAGQSLAEVTGLGMDILLMGTGAKGVAEASLGQGGTVYVSEADAVADYTAEGHAAAAAQLVQDKGYTQILATATTTGMCRRTTLPTRYRRVGGPASTGSPSR